MSKIADDIFNLVQKLNHVTFIELCDKIDGFKGDKSLWLDAPSMSNVLLWNDISEEASIALKELTDANRIHFEPTNAITYLIDGGLVSLPVAKREMHYKETHWLPSVLCSGPQRQRKAA